MSWVGASTKMTPTSKVYVAGHRGLVGAAITRGLQQNGYKFVVTRTHGELELADKTAVRQFFEQERPEFVFLAAAKVGGILANASYPADFLKQNLEIELNVLDAAREFGVKRLLFLGSSCIYPKLCPQPIKEEYLLTGPLEPTNRSYALAKIAGIEMCWSYNRQYGTRFLAAMPCNLYGTEDNFDLQSSHVLPALLRKAIEAKRRGDAEMVVWGTGTPRRELLHAADLAEGARFLLEQEDSVFETLMPEAEPPLINIGTGEDISIKDLAELVCSIAGYKGGLVFDTSKPDGTPRKLMDVSRMHALGWHHAISLESGIARVYETIRRTYEQEQVMP